MPDFVTARAEYMFYYNSSLAHKSHAERIFKLNTHFRARASRLNANDDDDDDGRNLVAATRAFRWKLVLSNIGSSLTKKYYIPLRLGDSDVFHAPKVCDDVPSARVHWRSA